MNANPKSLAVPVYAKDLEASHKAALGFQAAEAKRTRGVARGLKAMLASSTLINLMLAAGLLQALPAIRIVPVWAWLRADGTVASATTTSELPASMAESGQRAWLWQYVRMREEYNATTLHYNYDIVSGMSSPAVRAVYQTLVNGTDKTVPSLAKLLGHNGTISVTYRDSEIKGDQFHIRFWRMVSQEGQPKTCTPFVASLTFTVLKDLPLVQRVTYNPGALIVTEYPGAFPDGDPDHPEHLTKVCA